MRTGVPEQLLGLALRVIWPSPPLALRYSLALVLTVLVALVKVAFPESVEQGPGVLLTIPVAVSAVLAGLGPALVATAGATAVVAFFLPPAFVFAIRPDVSLFSLLAFLTEGLIISALGSGLRAALIRSLESVQRLEELQRERAALIATVSHEFRNPLAALSSHLQLALRYVGRDDLAFRLPRSLEVASAQVSRLLRLTEDLLVVATSGSGPFRVETDVINLPMAVDAAVTRVREADPSRSIAAIPPTAPVAVVGDRARLDQILDNLLKNAVRYSPQASAIELSVSADGAQRIGVVRVRDHGQGVSPAERDRIFERFARGSAARGVDGSGIGLYVSRELARRMGGRLFLDESSSDGSVFAIELPLAPADVMPLEVVETEAG